MNHAINRKERTATFGMDGNVNFKVSKISCEKYTTRPHSSIRDDSIKCEGKIVKDDLRI